MNLALKTDFFSKNIFAIHGRAGVSHGSAVGIATVCGLDDREVGVRVPVGSEFSISPYRPDRL
jgi:hypothetical protein